MTRLVLLHGSVTNAALTWRKQQALAAEYELVTPDRPGFPPGPPVARVDFEAEVPWLARSCGRATTSSGSPTAA